MPTDDHPTETQIPTMEPTVTPRTTYLTALTATLATSAFLVLGIGALGIIGAGGRPDRVYLAVLGVLILGTLGARLRPGGMALALAVTALTMVLTTGVALLAGVAGDAVVLDVVGLTAMDAALFALCEWLFRRAGHRSPTSR